MAKLLQILLFAAIMLFQLAVEGGSLMPISLRRYTDGFGKVGNCQLISRGFTAKDYVQDGLVFQLDGLERGTADTTKWVDLIRGHVFTLGDHGAWSNNGLNCLGGISATASNPDWDAPITVETVLTITGTLPTWGIVWCQRGWVSGQNPTRECVLFGEKPFFSSVSGGVEKTFQKNHLLSFSTVFAGDIASKIVVNDEDQVVSARSISWYTSDFGNFWYLGGTSNSYKFNGIIHSIRMYNRAPTTAEIAANYEIDKARFNLPD